MTAAELRARALAVREAHERIKARVRRLAAAGIVPADAPTHPLALALEHSVRIRTAAVLAAADEMDERGDNPAMASTCDEALRVLEEATTLQDRVTADAEARHARVRN